MVLVAKVLVGIMVVAVVVRQEQAEERREGESEQGGERAVGLGALFQF